MPSGKTIQDCIDEDITLQIAMARGIVNNKGLARWLIEEHGIEGTPDSIAQTLNRMETPGPSQSLQRALRDLSNVDVSTETGLDVLVLPRNGEALACILRFGRRCTPEDGEIIHLLTEEKTFTVVFSGRQRESAEECFGDISVEREIRNLADVQFMPAEGEEIPGQALGVALDLLYLASIDVAVVFGGPRGHHFLVPAGAKNEAIHVLTKYASG